MRITTLLFFTLLLTPLFLKSQVNLNQFAPTDPAIRIGKLQNGMTYYIRHNEEPKDRASFYMIQNVGALLENDSQNGLAHFLEHMSFNGTEHFPGNGIIHTLERYGVAFGRNINAYTGYNETVYNLSDVPVTNPALIDTCLLVLHDWSDYLLLTDKDIDDERGVIEEEWRTRHNADFRMQEKYFPVLLKGSKFVTHDVIGSLDVIKNFKYKTLRDFYHNWYRTDLQAIAIVGDINVDEVEAKVKAMFSGIPPVKNEKKRPFFPVPEHKDTRFVLATDPEASQYSVDIYILHNAVKPENKNIGYIRDYYISRLFNAMMGERISELLQKGTPPFVTGSIVYGGFLRGYDAMYISATANPNKEDVALKAIYTEAIRAKKFGFTKTEFERAKSNLLTSMERTYKQRDKISNDSYVAGIQENFLTNEPLTSAEYDWDEGQKLLKTISVDDVSEKAKEWIVDTNRTIVVQGPQGDSVKHINRDEAFAILKDVENSDIQPYKDVEQVSSLVKEPLTGSKIISTKKLDAFNAVQWTLANNARVVYRHADYEKDNVLLSAYSPGGSSVFDNNHIASVPLFSSFMNSYGVDGFDNITLNKMLAGKQVNLNVGLSALNESVSGSSSPKDFETLMQLLYLQFEHPRFDKQAYDALASRYRAYLANMQNDPEKIMSDSLSLILTNYSPRTILINEKTIDSTSFAGIEDIYKNRFIDAGDFTFFIVGNISEDTVRQMAEKYIGSIKDNPRKETWIDRGVRGPKGKTVKEIEVPMKTPKANIFVNYEKEMPYDPKENLEIRVLGDILQLRYTDEIREKEGGAYSIGVSGTSEHYPVEEKDLRINFDTDPARAEKLKKIVYGVIDTIATLGPRAEDLEKVVKNLEKDRQQSRQHNRYWLSVLRNYYINGFNTDSPENFEDILNSLTTDDIRQFAAKFLKSADLVDVTFEPKPGPK